MAEDATSDSDGPLIDDNVIRIQLRKPNHRKWELRTRNRSLSVKFPTIQLFDCEGNLLVETNDENISIKSSDFEDCSLRNSKSLREKDFRHFIDKKPLRKNKTISCGKIYTRVYRLPVASNISSKETKDNKTYIIKDEVSVTNIPTNLLINNNEVSLKVNNSDANPLTSEGPSEISSYKSSDNESLCCDNTYHVQSSKTALKNTENDKDLPRISILTPTIDLNDSSETKCQTFRIESDMHNHPVIKSHSFNNSDLSKEYKNDSLQRSRSGLAYNLPNNKVSFLNTYLRSLPTRASSNSDWLSVDRSKIVDCAQHAKALVKNDNPVKDEESYRFCKWDSASEDDFVNLPTDVAADCELKARLKLYRRGVSEIESRKRKTSESTSRRLSLSGSVRMLNSRSSSSESVDEADLVLNRLRRRILKNKLRDRKRSLGIKYFQFTPPARQNLPHSKYSRTSSHESCQDAEAVARGSACQIGLPHAMGSNISQHSTKGLKGRRARSSGDLCNGDTKSQTESSVCGSVVGDVMGWNRSLPNHLDGNRHLADYSRVNNNYGEFGSYHRRHPKGGRGVRYRIYNSGSEAEPVWKLQDPGCDQGYGSERSPEDDFAPPIEPGLSLEEYEAQLRAIYPFINDENTYTVVVEKDGRGLGMSVCGGGGLVRIRRLYPPQPAWRTGRLASKDLLLAANGVPLAGLSTYEALEVLRTASPRVELRVCRPPPDVLESVTPPDPPTPPARTPHPPHLPPLDPLNCHPLHTRLSATTSSATTSSSEGRGKREGSPEDRRELHLPGLDRPLPVFDVQYGEFDIIMTKVNGSLGFTLRKEDHSALGHYVRALVREPALSDGRIQPGDRIVAVNDTPMSNMSHAEAVAYLRACGSEVRLRLYRDHAATPLSPISPKEEPTTDSDAPVYNKPKPPLRAEAVSMLCDLAARRLTPDVADGSRSPCLSPRKFRRLTKDTNHYEQPIDRTSAKFTLDSLCIDGAFILQEIRPQQRSHSVTIISPTTPQNSRQQKLSLPVPSHGFELNNLDQDTLDAPNAYKEDIKQRFPEPAFCVDSDEPVSMPVELSSDEARFKHSNPTYQSAVLHTSTANESNTSDSSTKDDGNRLKKWKGVTLSPDNERKVTVINAQPKVKETVQKENVKPEPPKADANNEPTIVTVELNRGWNSRLGFSVQSHPDSGQSYISAVYSDSVAARDGRLRRGDVILQVNDENVTSMKTPEVIDLLRILRGSICITVLRPSNT